MRRRKGRSASTALDENIDFDDLPSLQNSSVGESPSPLRYSDRGITWSDLLDPAEIFTSLTSILLTGWVIIYSSLLQAGNDMALGLARLWAGSSGGEKSEDGSDEGSSMQVLKSGLKGSVKRRRHKESSNNVSDGPGYYPGMVNLSGTLCYMNSVLQAFASLASLWAHLERIIVLAVEFDIPTPVTDTLLEVLQDLNTPHSRPPSPLRPHALLLALQTLPAIQRLLGTREQQDAHELFLVLAEAVSDESLKVAAEVARSKGLGEVLSLQGYAAGRAGGGVGSFTSRGLREKGIRERTRQRGLAQPWDGLLARRRVCRVCGWCEAVRMDTLGGMELSLPQNGDVSLEACIVQYFAPELLSDVTCEMCSLRRTYEYYQAEFNRLEGNSSSSSINPTHTKASSSRSGSGSFSALESMPNGKSPTPASTEMTASRRRRAKEVRRVETRLKSMLDSGTISHFGESTLPPTRGSAGNMGVPIKWQTVRTDSVREGIITRAPQTLRLHLIRSEYTPYGVLLKKSARVAFPLVMDLTKLVARGVWEDRGGGSVLGALAKARMSGSGGDQVEKPQPRVLYRLESVILHYGYTHSAGHYVCIRRKPQFHSSSSAPETSHNPPPDFNRPRNVRKSCPDGCSCESCVYFGQVRALDDEPEVTPGRGWLRISDDEVEEVGEEALVDCRSQVFMLFYERVGEFKGESRGDDVKPGGSSSERLGSGASIEERQSEMRGRRQDEEDTEGRRTPDTE